MAGFGALNTGATGLKAHDEAMGVISDNIANMNTTAFKESSPYFGDLLAQTIGHANSVGLTQVGSGSKLSMVKPDFSQGSLEGTGNATDLAIQGNGFFALKNPKTGQEAFTRAGNFTINEQGYLVNPSGDRVQGWSVKETEDGTIQNDGKLGDLNLNKVSSTADKTSRVVPSANLNADETPVNEEQVRGNFDPTDQGTYNFKTDMTVYDSLGAKHVVSVYFSKTGSNQWNYHVVGKSNDVQTSKLPSNDGEPEGEASPDLYGENDQLARIGVGSLEFNTDGSLKRENNGLFLEGDDVKTNPIQTPWSNGAEASQQIEFDMGSATAPNLEAGNGLNGIVQRSSKSVLYNANVDGRPTGELTGFSVEADGTLVGNFDNGSTKPLYRVALARFSTPEALTRDGNNRFVVNAQSGDPNISNPGSGGAGTVEGFHLEQSNVSAADEFVDMITIQRGYQANSKVISTADDMLQSLMQVVR
jgi:flagellar hook protein FlgE